MTQYPTNMSKLQVAMGRAEVPAPRNVDIEKELNALSDERNAAFTKSFERIDLAIAKMNEKQDIVEEDEENFPEDILDLNPGFLTGFDQDPSSKKYRELIMELLDKEDAAIQSRIDNCHAEIENIGQKLQVAYEFKDKIDGIIKKLDLLLSAETAKKNILNGVKEAVTMIKPQAKRGRPRKHNKPDEKSTQVPAKEITITSVSANEEVI